MRTIYRLDFTVKIPEKYVAYFLKEEKLTIKEVRHLINELCEELEGKIPNSLPREKFEALSDLLVGRGFERVEMDAYRISKNKTNELYLNYA